MSSWVPLRREGRGGVGRTDPELGVLDNRGDGDSGRGWEPEKAEDQWQAYLWTLLQKGVKFTRVGKCWNSRAERPTYVFIQEDQLLCPKKPFRLCV